MVQHDERDACRRFIAEWESPSEVLSIATSGSTGTPKHITVFKHQMRASAEMTCRFLGLKPSDTALLCLPTEYIAGKMMVVRSIVAQLRLLQVPPSTNPLREMDEHIDFAAMTPTQVFHSLRVPAEAERLRNIRCLIVGGSAMDEQTEATLRTFPHPIYATYGMTETVSHIALRRVNGAEPCRSYTPLDGVRVSLSPQHTLVIDAPLLTSETLTTNDCASILADGSFVIHGRIDNVVNSGGVKLQIEQLEAKLRGVFHRPFAFTSVPHPQWGEALVLLVERGEEKAYEHPKYVFCVDEIPHTGSQAKDATSARKASAKIDRKACRDLALSKLQEREHKGVEDTLMSHLDMCFTLLTETRVEATMPVNAGTRQPYGLLHGGASLALGESIAGVGSQLICKAGEVPVGAQVSANHVSSARGGDVVTGVGTLIHKGRSTHVWNIDVFTSSGKLVSTMRITNSIIKRQ